ncbi:MAG: hypothetical protein IJU96_02445 [Clostridia bacterium]|nr:hypothetical protein [Clostridia bacterium]
MMIADQIGNLPEYGGGVERLGRYEWNTLVAKTVPCRRPKRHTFGGVAVH